MRGLLRTYFPPLPRAVATLQVGGLVNAFGNGVVYPFLFIYLYNVRGIGLAVVGLILATHALTSIVAGPVFGSQIDRSGGRRCWRSRSPSSPSATRRTRSCTSPGKASSSPR